MSGNRVLRGLRSCLASPVVAAALLSPTVATAQANAIDPYAYTCGDLLAVANLEPGHGDTALANLMILWTVGYLYGRLEAAEGSNFNEENFDLVRDNTVAALTSICPNVRDLSIAAFASNLADDIERTIGVE